MNPKANLLRLCMFLLIAPAMAADAQMVVVPGKDVRGEVFKRLGLPNQTYCWEQCLEEARCTGVRWAVIGASAAGQCQLISGPLTFIEPREIKTEDGQQIRVTVSRRERQ
jgi:PAN domain-containing protein